MLFPSSNGLLGAGSAYLGRERVCISAQLSSRLQRAIRFVELLATDEVSGMSKVAFSPFLLRDLLSPLLRLFGLRAENRRRGNGDRLLRFGNVGTQRRGTRQVNRSLVDAVLRRECANFIDLASREVRPAIRQIEPTYRAEPRDLQSRHIWWLVRVESLL
jgi:hypothetical protein